MSWRESNRTKVLSALRQQLETVSLNKKGMAFAPMLRAANLSRLTISCKGRQLVPGALDVPCDSGAMEPGEPPTIVDGWSTELIHIECHVPNWQSIPPISANALEVAEPQVSSALSSETAGEELLLSARDGSCSASVEPHDGESVDFSFAVRYSPRFSLLAPSVTLGTINLVLNALLSLSADQVDWNPRVKHLRLAFAEPKCERFEFDPANPDSPPRRLFSPRAPRAPVVRPPRRQISEHPQKPPGHEKASLKERLRWLLTPPIEELLSDPDLHLPAAPFPFQTFGIKWLYDRDAALLADEMGLGKTMQAIVAARLLWRFRLIKQVLIVCPKSLIPNWKSELAKWWPQSDGRVSVVPSCPGSA